MHAEPRHPDRLAFFFHGGRSPAAVLDQIQAEHPRTQGKRYSLQSGPAWVFYHVELDPPEQRQAALAAAESRLATTAALDWPHDAALFAAHAAALGNDKPETLAALLAAL